MAVSLAPALCAISELVRHALWSGGAPLHGDPHGGVERSYITELELQETPRLRPSCTYQDVWRPPVPGDPGKDHQVHGPLGEGTTCGPGGGRRGGRGCPLGQGRLQQRGGGRRRGVKLLQDCVLSGKLRQAVPRATDREGVGCLLPDDQCTKTGRPVAEVLQEKHPEMRAPPRGKYYVCSLRGV